MLPRTWNGCAHCRLSYIPMCAKHCTYSTTCTECTFLPARAVTILCVWRGTFSGRRAPRLIPHARPGYHKRWRGGIRGETNTSAIFCPSTSSTSRSRGVFKLPRRSGQGQRDNQPRQCKLCFSDIVKATVASGTFYRGGAIVC